MAADPPPTASPTGPRQCPPMPPDLDWPDWREEGDPELIEAVRESQRSRTMQHQDSSTGPPTSEARQPGWAGITPEDNEADYEHLVRLMEERKHDPPADPNHPLVKHLRDAEELARISSTTAPDPIPMVQTETEADFPPMHPTWVEELVWRANSDRSEWIHTPAGQKPDPNRFED
jgi:hypothetical protein